MLEFSYLSAKKSSVYNLIMNMFLSEFECFNLKLTAGEIMDNLSKPQYGSVVLDESELNNSLSYLINNHNLAASYDNDEQISSLEAYKNRIRYYSITKSGLYVARCVRTFMEESQNTVLCDEYFERILRDLEKCRLSPDDKSSWEVLYNDCRLVFQIYQDFLSGGSEIDEISSSSEFLAYKDNFVGQIHTLIDKLSRYSRRIGEKIKFLDTDDSRFNQIKNWFLFSDDCQPVYVTVLHHCSRLIEKVTRTARILTDCVHHDTDYVSLIRHMNTFKDIRDFQAYFEDIMGVQSVSHINFHNDFEPVIRNTVTSVVPEPVPYDESQKTDDDREALKIYDMEIDKERSVINLLDRDNILSPSTVNGHLSGDQLFTYLGWVSDAMNSGVDSGVTVGGESYRLVRRGSVEMIKTDEGVLELPDFSIVFTGVGE